MKTRILLLALTAAVLSSCGHYKLKSEHGKEHYPHNS
jgi:hypothetical protein